MSESDEEFAIGSAIHNCQNEMCKIDEVAAVGGVLEATPAEILAREAIQSYKQAMLAKGWKMCPREATEKMAACHVEDWRLRHDNWSNQWDAAPDPGDSE